MHSSSSFGKRIQLLFPFMTLSPFSSPLSFSLPFLPPRLSISISLPHSLCIFSSLSLPPPLSFTLSLSLLPFPLSSLSLCFLSFSLSLRLSQLLTNDYVCWRVHTHTHIHKRTKNKAPHNLHQPLPPAISVIDLNNIPFSYGPSTALHSLVLSLCTFAGHR